VRFTAHTAQNSGRPFLKCSRSECQHFEWLNPYCTCGSVSAVRTVQKAGRNHGKQFFKCSNSSCTNRSFFVWASAAADHYSLQNIPVYGAAINNIAAAAAAAAAPPVAAAPVAAAPVAAAPVAAVPVAAVPVAAVPAAQYRSRYSSSGASPGSKTAAFLSNFAAGSGGSGSGSGSSRSYSQQSAAKRARII
jgi:hypothetical protein